MNVIHIYICAHQEKTHDTVGFVLSDKDEIGITFKKLVRPVIMHL